MVNHDLKLVFIHIPKCAGTSINRMFDMKPYGFSGHAPIKYHEDLLDKGYRAFTIVRNPYDRAVSLYHYFSQMKEGDRWYGKNIDIAKACRDIGFDDFVGEMRDFQTHEYSGIHFYPQSYFACHSYSSSPKDTRKVYKCKIVTFEGLDNSLKDVCDTFNINLPKVKKLNSTRHLDYKGYYNSKQTIRMIKRLYGSDFMQFNYSFNL